MAKDTLARKWALSARTAIGDISLNIGDIDTLSETLLLDAVAGMADGDLIRVVNARDGGVWKFHSGDLSAFVAADPYGGLWRAPAAAPTGALGAWQRMVEKGIYDAEWWLPDDMPSDAQVRINSGILAIPDDGARFMLPRREVTTTGSVRFAKALTFEGFGRDCPINGGGGNFFATEITVNNVRLVNISAGNVAGQLSYGEAGGFHVHSGETFWQATRSVENISAVDCHTFDAQTGFRCGVGVLNATTGASPDSDDDVTLFPSRDIHIENFQCDGIQRIGIECMRANGVQVYGGRVEMQIPDTIVGFDRGVRIAAAHNIHINGLHIVAPDTTTVRGISVEGASQGGGGSFPYTYGGSSNVTVEASMIEDCTTGFAVTNGNSRNIRFLNSRVVGRRDTFAHGTVTVDGNATSNGFAIEEAPHRNIRVEGISAINVASFANLDGHIYGLTIKHNVMIANSATGTAAQTFVYAASGSARRFIEVEVARNTAITSGATSTQTVRMLTLDSQSVLTFNDNRFTADSSGVVFNITGDATVYQRSRDSNRTLPTSLWASVKPPLDQDDWPVGDGEIL